MTSALQRIALNVHSEYRYFFADLAAYLKKHHGSHITLYGYTRQEIDFYRRPEFGGIFDALVLAEHPLRACFNPATDEDAIVAKARRYESLVGCTYGTLAHSNRHLGRGYVLGGSRHPRSRQSEQTSYLQMLNAYNETFDFWDREVREKKLTMILSGNKVLARAAHANGLPFRRIAGARYQNYYFWSPSEFFQHPELERCYQRTEKADVAMIDEAYHSHRVYSQKIIRGSSFVGMSRRVAVQALRRIYWQLRGYDKARSTYALDELRYLSRMWFDYRRMTGPNMTPLSAIVGKPFIFYPLHTEPEASVNELSPEYSYQHAAIASLSRDLPAGAYLAVKETVYGTGRRPVDFYAQIKSLKNVIFLNMLEPGHEVVKHAAAVATITGTAGFEAAVMGKPVISFGRHNLYRFLPHVMIVEDEARLKDQVASVFDDSIDVERARLDGARYLKAVIETAFDLGTYSNLALRDYDDATVARAAGGLVDSLRWARDLPDRELGDATVV